MEETREHTAVKTARAQSDKVRPPSARSRNRDPLTPGRFLLTETESAKFSRIITLEPILSQPPSVNTRGLCCSRKMSVMSEVKGFLGIFESPLVNAGDFFLRMTKLQLNERNSLVCINKCRICVK